MTEVRILYRDADLLVLFKPAGLPTTSPDGRGCLTEIAERLDPDAARLHASSRLDAEVTGIVTFARSTRAIEGLLAARRDGHYERYYLGLAVGAPSPAAGEFDWPIDRDPRDPRKRVTLDHPGPRGEEVPRRSAQRAAKSGTGQGAAASGTRSAGTAQEARTRYKVLGSLPTAALLLLSPLTGRTHQLRVHVARAGVPLLGDRHYGGPVRCTLPDGRVVRAGRVMLHCARVRLPNIADGTPLTLDAPIPDDFRAVWLGLGGGLDSLEHALQDV